MRVLVARCTVRPVSKREVATFLSGGSRGGPRTSSLALSVPVSAFQAHIERRGLDPLDLTRGTARTDFILPVYGTFVHAAEPQWLNHIILLSLGSSGPRRRDAGSER
eukprot:scaffold1874_cov237-Pinguiococcus_pyrenoidosus.AAC.6